MKSLLSFLWLLFLAGSVWSADPVPVPVTPDAVELPPAPPQPVSPPPPAGTNVRLTPGVIYPVKCRVPCVVRAYPAGLVSITSDEVAAGETLRDKGNFSDGTKLKVYKGPMTVYSITVDVAAMQAKGLEAGSVSVVIVPLGLKAEKEIVTVPIDVEAGTGPQPPPPGPKPDSALVAEFKSLFAADTGANKADDIVKLAALYRKADAAADSTGVTTNGALKAVLVAARKASIADDALVAIRHRIEKELEPIGTNPSVALTADSRKTAKACFAKVATALEAVK